MSDDKRLDNLQEEIKLMKGELKQSLASVRDYLLNMELPASEISSILSELGDENQKVTMQGNLSTPTEEKPPVPEDALTQTEEEQTLEDENVPDEGDDLLDLEEPEEPLVDENNDEDEPEPPPEDTLNAGEEEPVAEEDLAAPEDTLEEEPEEPVLEEPEMSAEEEQPIQEEQPMPYENTIDESSLSVPRVNMLANLINWVARANKEIGREQMATFLEVYGISGHLSPELKEVILQLSEITANEPDIATSTEIWSHSMLLLHGILTGGDAPLHPAIPVWNRQDAEKAAAEEEIIEVDKAKDRPLKLKLVLPDEDGEEKEFCINLTPEAESSQSK
jgi:hypothetical protein